MACNESIEFLNGNFSCFFSLKLAQNSFLVLAYDDINDEDDATSLDAVSVSTGTGGGVSTQTHSRAAPKTTTQKTKSETTATIAVGVGNKMDEMLNEDLKNIDEKRK